MVAIFFGLFLQARGGMAPLAPPPGSATEASPEYIFVKTLFLPLKWRQNFLERF